MSEQIKLPDGWVWRDYDQPTVTSKNASSGKDVSRSCPDLRIRTWGVIPVEVEHAFDLRLLEIEKDKEIAELKSKVEDLEDHIEYLDSCHLVAGETP